MVITDAKYISVDGANSNVVVTIDGQKLFVPINPSNRHYAEILKQVKSGDLTIAKAD